MKTKTATTKPYTPAALFRVYDKQTGAVLGYLAPSRNGKDFYHVTCDQDGRWHCDCMATKPCCHIKAASELCEIRAKDGRPAHRQPVAEVAAQEDMANYQFWMDELDPDKKAREEATAETTPDVDESNEEALIQQMTDQCLIEHAALNGNRRNNVLMPPPSAAPTPRKVDMRYFMRA